MVPGSLGSGGTGLPNGPYNTAGAFPGGLPPMRLGSQVVKGRRLRRRHPRG